jgi:chemotaxis protein histidine kinase CheA/CheY-like chemotaxis protein
LEPNALPNLELTDLDDDFLGLESEDEIDLTNLLGESFAAETPSLSLDADSEPEIADLAGLFESEDLSNFNFNQSEESLDLNLNASETSDELDSLFDENSEDLGLLFAETPISELETTDLLGFLIADDQQVSEESIADSPLPLDRSESEPLSDDLDDLLNLAAIEEETASDFDLLLDNDPLDSLDDLLSDDLGSELTEQTFDLSLNLESELFETASYQENEQLEIPGELGSIAAQSLFGLDSDELSLESSTDDLDESSFDLFSSSEDIASEEDTSDTLLNDLGLDFSLEAASVQNTGEADDLDLLFDLEDSASSAESDDFDLEFDPFDDSPIAPSDSGSLTSSAENDDFDLEFDPFDDSSLEELSDFEPLETEASSTKPADPSGFNPLLGAGIAAASVISLGAAMAASHNSDESDENDSELDVLETESNLATDDEFGDLDDLLDATLSDASEPSDPENFDDLDSLFGEETADSVAEAESLDTLLDETPANFDEFDDLDDLLGDDLSPIAQDLTSENFDDLESLLADAPETFAAAAQTGFSATDDSDMEFDDLEKMLEDADKTMGGTPAAKSLASTQSARRTNRPGKGLSDQTMRVPVKHLDNLSNLVGELVVNRNSLEQDQERLRQSLDNLLYQVQQLSDVGQRMQDLYERSLLESSLLASRNQRTPSIFSASIRDSSAITPSNSSGVEYDPLEMDRFTGFHSLSQEMIELIVRVRESASDIEFIVDETDQVTRMFRQVTTQLQEGLTRSRMVPFAQTADRLPRAVRDIAMKCGKQAELVIEGRDTLIDKMILEHLYDPMTHLVNNAITHGIETPDVRRAAGKSPVGKITIRAFHQGNQTVISVSDDGAGVDIERVKVKAIEKGLITSSESKAMARLDIYDLLFHPGFTTKDQADDFSGRGVGMDVVRTSLSEIRGVINTDSALSKGTTFTVRLPLTLSISKALCCISDRARIAFPMDGVEDMLDIPKERIQTDSEGNPVIAWRDAILPLRPLTDLLGYSRHLSRGNVYGGNQEDDMVSVVVLRSAGNYLALQVDQVLGEQEIVIKQLEGPVPKPIGVAGATVLGDGRIMPIADVLELIDLSMGRIRRDVGTMWDQGASQSTDTITMKTEPTVLIVDDSITVRELLSMTFNKVGYRVEQARDGQEAWEKLRAGLPCDIVFCDIEMPRMDGLELLSRIQKDPNLSSLPIAMLTSRGADRHRQMAASLGASGYFTKPYLEEALLDAAQRMLKGEILIVNNRDS